MPEQSSFGSFFERTEELLERVGDGELTGVTNVDQAYAENQEKGGWENFMGRFGPKEIQNHPRGGGPPPSRFLSAPFEERTEEFMGRLAESVTDGDLTEEMASIQEDLADEVFRRAPRKDEALASSASVTVYDEGRPVYHRPADVPRIDP